VDQEGGAGRQDEELSIIVRAFLAGSRKRGSLIKKGKFVGTTKNGSLAVVAFEQRDRGDAVPFFVYRSAVLTGGGRSP
jgi:hypothetical protein